MIIKIVLSVVIGYLLGSVNSSIIVGKLYRKDIREYGSKNAGLTNTMRVLGKKAAIFVLCADVLKGVLASLIGFYLINDGYLGYTIGGLFAIIGHNWPVYFNFRGGKGALTAVAVAFTIDYKSAIVLLLVFILIVYFIKIVSVGTIVAAIIYPISAYVFTKDLYMLGYTILVAILVIYRHRANILRLIKGEENRLSLGKKIGGNMNYKELYSLWLKEDIFDEETKKELKEISNDENEIKDRFYKELEFGTGGLRGIIGAGTNRINIYTIRKATQGVCNYVLKLGSLAMKKGAVIAYDSRIKSDVFC